MALLFSRYFRMRIWGAGWAQTAGAPGSGALSVQSWEHVVWTGCVRLSAHVSQAVSNGQRLWLQPQTEGAPSRLIPSGWAGNSFHVRDRALLLVQSQGVHGYDCAPHAEHTHQLECGTSEPVFLSQNLVDVRLRLSLLSLQGPACSTGSRHGFPLTSCLFCVLWCSLNNAFFTWLSPKTVRKFTGNCTLDTNANTAAPQMLTPALVYKGISKAWGQKRSPESTKLSSPRNCFSNISHSYIISQFLTTLENHLLCY